RVLRPNRRPKLTTQTSPWLAPDRAIGWSNLPRGSPAPASRVEVGGASGEPDGSLELVEDVGERSAPGPGEPRAEFDGAGEVAERVARESRDLAARAEGVPHVHFVRT